MPEITPAPSSLPIKQALSSKALMLKVGQIRRVNLRKGIVLKRVSFSYRPRLNEAEL